MSKSQILKFFIFLFTVLILDQATGLILKHLFFQQKTGPGYQLNYGFSECTEDVLIFGNSRAQHHYIPQLISEALKLSCYNVGLDGGHSILLPFAQIKALTNRYSPKIIIIEMSPDDLYTSKEAYDRLSLLLPYCKKYPDVYPLILLRNPYEKIKLLSAIYPFNSILINIIRFNTNTHAARKQDFNGYLPITGIMSTDMLEQRPAAIEKEISVVDENMVKALENIIQICKEKSITLFVINSPVYHAINEKQMAPSSSTQRFLEIIQHHKVNYVDLSSDQSFKGHFELFLDVIHLNDDGAKIFTNMVINKILQAS